jgi:hypothetical protein
VTPDGEGERRREGGGASSKLTYSRVELRARLTVGFSPAPATGTRGRGGRLFGHPVGEVGVEEGSREDPAPAGTTGADRTVADCVKR